MRDRSVDMIGLRVGVTLGRLGPEKLGDSGVAEKDKDLEDL